MRVSPFFCRKKNRAVSGKGSRGVYDEYSLNNVFKMSLYISFTDYYLPSYCIRLDHIFINGNRQSGKGKRFYPNMHPISTD